MANPPVDLDDPRALIRNGREPSLTDLGFHQQMVYAVCTSIYDVFREALGRDPSRGFAARPGEARPILQVRPHAFNGQNAFYDPRTGQLNFGYFDAGTAEGRNLPHGRVFTCLSHDIVAHEMTHALLDGMRARLRLATNPDVLGFHEGFADLVAIFMHFSYREVVRAAIERSAGMPEMDGLLVSVAQQFGQTMTRTNQSGPLRSAIDEEGFGDANSKSKPKLYAETGQEPHALGSVLISAVFELSRSCSGARRAATDGSPGQHPRIRFAPSLRTSWPARQACSLASSVDLHPCHLLLPPHRPASGRVSPRAHHCGLRPGPRRSGRLPGGVHRRLRSARHLSGRGPEPVGGRLALAPANHRIGAHSSAPFQ